MLDFDQRFFRVTAGVNDEEGVSNPMYNQICKESQLTSYMMDANKFATKNAIMDEQIYIRIIEITSDVKICFEMNSSPDEEYDLETKMLEHELWSNGYL